MKTVSLRKEDIERSWWLVDADGKTLVRIATGIATKLRGKHKPEYTPHIDTGDYVVVVNAEKVKLTGNKEKDKIYWRHTGYPGGIKNINAAKLRKKHPERLIEKAVKGMLPRNALGRAMYRKLRVYAGGEHPHKGQSPKGMDI